MNGEMVRARWGLAWGISISIEAWNICSQPRFLALPNRQWHRVLLKGVVIPRLAIRSAPQCLIKLSISLLHEYKYCMGFKTHMLSRVMIGDSVSPFHLLCSCSSTVLEVLEVLERHQ